MKEMLKDTCYLENIFWIFSFIFSFVLVQNLCYPYHLNLYLNSRVYTYTGLCMFMQCITQKHVHVNEYMDVESVREYIEKVKKHI